MPAHSVPADDLIDEIARFESKGHRIVAVTTAGEGAYVVVTEKPLKTRVAPGDKETRG